jgi:hypothetical protein
LLSKGVSIVREEMVYIFNFVCQILKAQTGKVCQISNSFGEKNSVAVISGHKEELVVKVILE